MLMEPSATSCMHNYHLKITVNGASLIHKITAGDKTMTNKNKYFYVIFQSKLCANIVFRIVISFCIRFVIRNICLCKTIQYLKNENCDFVIKIVFDYANNNSIYGVFLIHNVQLSADSERHSSK